MARQHSSAGIVGAEFTSAYATAKFGLEGWMESLTIEVEPFAIRARLVKPGFFCTALLKPESTGYAEPTIDDAHRELSSSLAHHGARAQPLSRALRDHACQEGAIASAIVRVVHQQQRAQSLSKTEEQRAEIGAWATFWPQLRSGAEAMGKANAVRR